MEGAPCTGNAQCEADLACIEVQTASPPLPALNVCARGCATGTDCGTEICFSYTGQMEDAFCANVVRQQFGECGYETTSVCTAGRSCLFFTDTAGVCVDLCVLESGADAGTDDAGTTGGGPLPTGFVECSGTQTCIEGVVLQEMGFEGVCGDLAARGEPCGPDVGAFCNEGDLCAPEDPDDLMGPTRCYQDCSERNATCDEGMCTDIRGAFAYCLP